MDPVLRSYLEAIAPEVETALRRCLAPKAGAAADLYEAMAYSVFAGGKRLRPALVLAGSIVTRSPQSFEFAITLNQD